MISLLFFITTHCKVLEATPTETDLRHVAGYIGSHANTPDYAFQEALRRNDLGLKQSIEKSGHKDAEKFFINGWGQVIGALLALNNHTVSPELHALVDQHIDTAIEKGTKKTNPFVHVNVREQTKQIMMYPHQGTYLPWRKTTITRPIATLNEMLPKYPARFSLVEGKCYVTIGQSGKPTIFNELWARDFATTLHEHQYRGLQPNREHPHITLINSNVIAAIKDKFIEKYGAYGANKFNNFIETWMLAANEELRKESNPIVFTQFDSAYSEDYSPFEEVLVAKLKAPAIKKMLTLLGQQTKDAVNYTLPIQHEDSFHVTVATKYRKPHDMGATTIENIVSSCSKKSDALLQFLEQFKQQANQVS